MSTISDSFYILHVDDEPDFAHTVGGLLEREDDRFTTTTATNASNGLEILSTERIDCVISDYEMPGQNGIEFLEAVRNAHPDLPFILFTGKGSEEIASEAISAGVSEYLQKTNGTDQYALLANRIINLVEKYRAERARERHNVLIKEATDAIFVVGEDATIQYVTPSSEAILDRMPEELVGMNSFELIHPGDRAHVVEEFTILVDAPDDSCTVEFRYERPDGTWIWAEARGRNLIDRDLIDGIVVYLRDITDREECKQDLRRYRQIVNTIQEAACIYDRNGRFDIVNESLAEYYGTIPASLVGKPSQLIPQIREEWDGDPYQELLDGERAELQGEIEANLPGHGSAVLAYRLMPLEIDGVIEGVVGATHEATDDRGHEAELDDQNEGLGKFAGLMGHDLRNPLNVAEARLELAKAECSSEHLKVVERGHNRMRVLIEDMLTLAQSGSQVTDIEYVVLPDLVRECWETVDTTETTLSVETEQTIQADASRLHQLLVNLLRNAIKYGGSTVTVGELDSGFYVADDGPGIPEDERGKVFEMGYSNGESFGFGLTVCKQVADIHGWTISIVEGSDGGARFEVSGVELK